MAAGDAAYRILDAGTRAFWRTVGRRVDLDGEHSWLRAPAADSGAIGESWLDTAAASVAGTVGRGEGGGLVPGLAALDGPGFAADSLDPDVRHSLRLHYRMRRGKVDRTTSRLVS